MGGFGVCFLCVWGFLRCMSKYGAWLEIGVCRSKWIWLVCSAKRDFWNYLSVRDYACVWKCWHKISVYLEAFGECWYLVCCACIYGCVWWVGGSPHVFLWLPLCQCVWACARWLCSFFGPFRLKAWPGLWSSLPLPFLRGAPVQCNSATDEWKLNLICSLHRVMHPWITWIYSLSCHSRCLVFLSFAKHKMRNFEECSQSYVLLQLAFKI